MTKQRALVVSAIVGNGLVIVLSSTAIGGFVWVERHVLGDPFVIGILFVMVVMLGPLIAVASWNLLCVRDALTRRGQSRTTAIARGKTLCVAMAVAGLPLSLCIFFPVPLIVIGAIAFVTNMVYRNVLAETQHGFFCPQCDYDLVGLLGANGDRGNGVCPECGLQVKPEPGT